MIGDAKEPPSAKYIYDGRMFPAPKVILVNPIMHF